MSLVTLSAQQVLSKPSEYLGKVVALHGILAMAADGQGRLVASSDQREDLGQSVLLQLVGLKERLLASVPPLGGGKYYYLNNAAVSGVLDSDPNQVHACRLVNVRSIEIEVSGELFAVGVAGNADA